MYTGKAESQENPEVNKEFGVGGKVVLSLLIDAKNKNHKVFMDNYFSSIPLMEELKSKVMLACGTIRSNRKDAKRRQVPQQRSVRLQVHSFWYNCFQVEGFQIRAFSFQLSWNWRNLSPMKAERWQQGDGFLPTGSEGLQ